jgi:hypothetical protein
VFDRASRVAGQDDDGDVLGAVILPELMSDGNTVETRHGEVQHNQVRAHAACQLQSLLAVCSCQHPEAHELKVLAVQFADIEGIVDYQDERLPTRTQPWAPLPFRGCSMRLERIILGSAVCFLR